MMILSILMVMVSWGKLSPAATDLKTLLPAQDLPTGWALIDGPHVYTRKNLFEHVDGQAILYIKYGFQRSVFAIFQNGKDPKNQMEVDIYDMGNVLHAFGVFSRFRNDDRSGGIGSDSYLDDRSIFFYKGKYFAMLYATETNASILKQLAVTISAKIVDSSPPPMEIGLFPKEGLKAGSIQYFAEGLLGHDFLGRGFQASYIDKDEEKVEDKAEAKESHLFLAILKNSKDAQGALSAYKNYISKRGKILSGNSTTFGPDAWKGEDPYQGQLIVLQKGFYLTGAIGFTDKRGEAYLDKFVKNIK
jgi:hypothetical protein